MALLPLVRVGLLQNLLCIAVSLAHTLKKCSDYGDETAKNPIEKKLSAIISDLQEAAVVKSISKLTHSIPQTTRIVNNG